MAGVFKKPNLSNDWKCLICRQATEKPVILVPIPGTEDDGIAEAHQIHHECAIIVAHAIIEAPEGGEA